MAKKILVADDSRIIQHAVTIALASEDVELLRVGDPAKVQPRAQSKSPDIVLLDNHMNKKGIDDGYDVCQKLKQNPATSHIPVLFLAGKSFDEAKAKSVGGDDFIEKPFVTDDLVSKINNLLSAPAAQVEAQPIRPKKKKEVPFKETTAIPMTNPIDFANMLPPDAKKEYLDAVNKKQGGAPAPTPPPIPQSLANAAPEAPVPTPPPVPAFGSKPAGGVPDIPPPPFGGGAPAPTPPPIPKSNPFDAGPPSIPSPPSIPAPPVAAESGSSDAVIPPPPFGGGAPASTPAPPAFEPPAPPFGGGAPAEEDRPRIETQVIPPPSREPQTFPVNNYLRDEPSEEAESQLEMEAPEFMEPAPIKAAPPAPVPTPPAVPAAASSGSVPSFAIGSQDFLARALSRESHVARLYSVVVHPNQK